MFWGDLESADILNKNIKSNSWLGIELDRWFYYKEPKKDVQSGLPKSYGGY